MVTRAALIGLFAFTCVYAGFLFTFFPQWQDQERLAHHGNRTTGVVTAKPPLNHESVRYEYSVGDSRYSGLSRAGLADHVQVGEPISVTYLPERPAMSTAPDAGESFFGISFFCFAVGPFACGLAGLAVGIWVHSRMRKPSNQSVELTATRQENYKGEIRK
jgi:hypothetical protein